ncbi:hypothetical protein ACJA88_010924 [Fusarium oxysporum]
MPLVPTTTILSVAACLVRLPLSQKIHSAPNLRDADNSSSAVIVTRRSASDSIEDPTPPTPPIELQFLDSRSKKFVSTTVQSITTDPKLHEFVLLDIRFIFYRSQAVTSTAQQEKFKRGVWAVAFAACIFAGTITGAQLKTDNEKKEAIQEFRATSPNEQIAALLSQRKTLVSQKAVLQRKMDDFEVRVKEREAEKAREKESP